MRQFRCCLVCLLTLTIPCVLPAAVRVVKARRIEVIKDKQGAQVGFYKESHALLIGVSDYTAGWADLAGVKQDIPKVKAALENHGFTVTAVLDPTGGELERAVKSFISRHGRAAENRLIIYYSGHGYTLKKKWGGDMGYIVPSDAPDPNVDGDSFTDKAIDMVKVEGWARNIDSKHAIFLFDSCFSASLFSLSKAAPAVINFKTSNPVRQFIIAGSEDETLPDRSVFCRQFLDALTGEGDRNRDGYITGSELGEYLQSTVANYSYDSQHPQYGKIRDRRLDKGDFVFLLDYASAAGAGRTDVSDEAGGEPAAEVLKGSLVVNSPRAGFVGINGDGRFPIKQGESLRWDNNLPAGTHVVAVESEGKVWRQTVTIHEGQVTTVSAAFEIQGRTDGSQGQADRHQGRTEGHDGQTDGSQGQTGI